MFSTTVGPLVNSKDPAYLLTNIIAQRLFLTILNSFSIQY